MRMQISRKLIYYIFLLSIICIACFFTINLGKKYKILVLWTGAGEHEWAKRLETVASSFNWECRTAFCPQELSSLEQVLFSESDSSLSADQVAQEFKPDFIISLSKRCQRVASSAKNYLAISGDSTRVFDVTCPCPEEFLDFDGFLYASPAIEKIRAYIESSGKEFQGIDWYPSCPATLYRPTIPKRLFYCGFQWDRKRNGEEYRKAFSLLDKQGYFDVYGPLDRWECAPNSRRGYLPFDGKSLSEAIRRSGIALVLHAQSHLDLEAPTGRIFEAASACSVIICDKNPFVVKEFGDTILYVDGDVDGEQLFFQIDTHMKWILSHPKEAQDKAQKAHALFLKKFTLEKQMENLIELHNKTTALTGEF